MNIKLRIIIGVLISLSFLKPNTHVYALCARTQVDSSYKYRKNYDLRVYDSSQCHTNDANDRGVPGNGVYEVWCQYPTEINSDDSLRAPLCGSSEELFQANNTCWGCEGDLRCAGANQSALSLGETDINLSLDNRSPINTGDSVDRVWVVTSPPSGKFKFNGTEYDLNGRRLIVCTDNVGGCGATDVKCTNEKYSCFDNQGGDCGTRSGSSGSGSSGEDSEERDEVIETIPGIEFTPVSGRREQKVGEVVNGTASWNPFSSLARAFAFFAPCGSNAACAEKTYLKEMADQQENLVSRGYLTPISMEYKPASRAIDELRYQYVGCYKAPENPISEYQKIQNIILRAVDPDISATKEAQKERNRILEGGRTLCAITGACDPLASLKFATPRQDFYTEENGKLKLKKELEGIFKPCDQVSSGLNMQSEKVEVVGTIEGGEQLPVQATLDQVKEFASNFRGFAHCLTSLENLIECASRIVGYDLEFKIATICPGCPTSSAFFRGGLQDSDIPPGAPASARAYLTKPKPGGLTGASLPQSVIAAMPGYSGSHGSVDSEADVVMEGSPQVLAAASINLKYSGDWGTYRSWFLADKCAPIPLSLQKDPEACKPDNLSDNTPTSDWANDPIPIVSNPTPDNPLLQKAIENATDGKVPVCILEGIAMAEGGYGKDWSDSAQCKVNQCSAAGPFQMTTGWVPEDYPDEKKFIGVVPEPGMKLSQFCAKCRTNGIDCPDAWILNDWPNDLTQPNPCETGTAAREALEHIQIKAERITGGRITNAPATTQKNRIIRSADAYGPQPPKPYDRFNGCTYGEYVYQHCDSNYICTQQLRR